MYIHILKMDFGKISFERTKSHMYIHILKLDFG